MPPSGSAYADQVDPATAPGVRSITYNVCGGHEGCRRGLDTAARTGLTVDQITAWDADAVLLQELCVGQWVALADALPGYSAVRTGTTAPGDANGDGTPDLWTRDRTTGTLRLHPSTGTGALGTRVAMADCTWTATTAPPSAPRPTPARRAPWPSTPARPRAASAIR
ncbi:hypothetical protein OG194_10790 [Streptomyces sp. NBC_01288]|uniref:endonuclease/exonuclease/phosphatase family protein n=1 Tax=Streptomyces sp. NBC_01288 TaxID=2903814 RepID=UPI002E1059CA|nr:hypothetical protein OG194_10790 [Streptomyces sp. NBC_01288]